MIYPYEQAYCENWDEVQVLCRLKYPEKCLKRAECIDASNREFKKAERADAEHTTNYKI